MKRREFIIVLAAAAGPRAASAQAPARIVRLGLLVPTSAAVPEIQALFDELARLGYHEGETLVVERRFATGDNRRLPALAVDLVRSGVDIIVVQSSGAAQAAKAATTTIPIVMGSSAEVLATGLVASLAHPGGNVTGISFLGAEWILKHIELIFELRAGAARLAFLGNFTFLPEPAMYRDLEAAAARRGASMALYDLRSADDYERAFAAMRDAHVDGLLVAPNVIHRERREQIVALAARFGVPAVYGSRDMVEAGGLISYGVDFHDLWRNAAHFVDKILKGAKPGDLPIEQPTRFELVINLKTAKALNLTIPASLLALADEVIE